MRKWRQKYCLFIDSLGSSGTECIIAGAYYSPIASHLDGKITDEYFCGAISGTNGDQRKPKYLEKSRSCADLSVTNTTWLEPRSNPGSHCRQSETDRLSLRQGLRKIQNIVNLYSGWNWDISSLLSVTSQPDEASSASDILRINIAQCTRNASHIL